MTYINYFIRVQHQHEDEKTLSYDVYNLPSSYRPPLSPEELFYVH